MDKATDGRKRTELLHDMTENRTYIQMRDLALDSIESEIEKKSVINPLKTAEDQRRMHVLPIYTYTRCLYPTAGKCLDAAG